MPELKYDNPMEINTSIYNSPHVAKLTLESFEAVKKVLTELGVQVETFVPGHHFIGAEDHAIQVNYFEPGRYDLCTTFKTVPEFVRYYRAFMDGYEIALINMERDMKDKPPA